ncbi:MAG: sigma-70 family RNA polymerase sigma factor [Candidatus Methanoperedens sp.]|nr:sigma-70 family RNA polymerase sigma factor [Candidatus Methanoperedens sp.]
MGLPATKRYLIELLHMHKLTYEQVAQYTGLPVERVKAIKKGEEPTDIEQYKLKQVAFSLSDLRSKDTGETMD